MRCPSVYSASDLVNWTISEEYKPGKWRPARCCGYWSIFHIRQQFRIAWRVLIGRYDAVNWGDTSGEVKSTERRYKDCCDPEFFTATKVHEYTIS
jgi:hypothetical protein